MSAEREVQDAVAGLISRHAGLGTGFDEDLWSALERAGFTEFDADLRVARAVVRACGAAAVMVPAAESVLVGRWLATQIDIDLPRIGPVVTAWCERCASSRVGPHAALSARAVPWADALMAVVAIIDSGDEINVVVPGPRGAITPTTPNAAGEPRADVLIDSHQVARPTTLGGAVATELRRRRALARAVALDAVITATVEMTLRYAVQRHQFGRPIASFQLVRHRLAELIGERDSVSALVKTAISGEECDPQMSAVAARVRAGDAATNVARIAHQVHGAIGTTEEFRLSRLTRRLWAWRDEYGSQGEWESILGHRLTSAPDGLWSLLTSVPRDVSYGSRRVAR